MTAYLFSKTEPCVVSCTSGLDVFFLAEERRCEIFHYFDNCFHLILAEDRDKRCWEFCGQTGSNYNMQHWHIKHIFGCLIHGYELQLRESSPCFYVYWKSSLRFKMLYSVILLPWYGGKALSFVALDFISWDKSKASLVQRNFRAILLGGCVTLVKNAVSWAKDTQICWCLSQYNETARWISTLGTWGIFSMFVIMKFLWRTLGWECLFLKVLLSCVPLFL